MLKALYDYAISHNLSLPPGFTPKTIKAYIDLDSRAEDYVGIFLGDSEAVPCPDIGSLANGTDKCNALVEKLSVVFPERPTAKSVFFLDALKSAAEAEPALQICVSALENEEIQGHILQQLREKKVKPTDRISFRVDGVRIVDRETVISWWREYRKQFQRQGEEGKSLCLITGMPTLPMSTTPSVTGLRTVGGHASGDALLCFDKSAFCSYGLKQGANAPVSEEAYAAVKAGLDDLLKDAPVLAGMKFVHWYEGDVKLEEDPIWTCGDFGDLGTPEEDGEPDARERELEEQAVRRNADRLVLSARTGERDIQLGNTVYHILLLTGVGGRVMIRRYEQGRYRQLKENLDAWNRDLELKNRSGNQLLPSCKLTARLIRLLKPQKSDRRPFERLGKELSGMTPAILHAILNGGPLPDGAAVRALQSIRSQMLTAENENSLFFELGLCCQWLKVWLIRNQKKGDLIVSGYNPELQSQAYQCGALLAVYEGIQAMAYPNVNVTVVQRYYSSAIQTPALVLGRLSQLSVHHLRELGRTNKGLQVNYSRLLNQVASRIPWPVPSTLTLPQQAEFALGYYQMNADMSEYLKTNKAVDAK